MVSIELNGAEVRRLESPDTGRSLAVIAANGMVFSAWRPSPEELVAMTQGRSVWVVIRGELVPEFHLTVGDRAQVIPPEVIRKAAKQQAQVNSPQAKAYKARSRREAVLVEALAYFYAFVALAATSCVLAATWRYLRG
jgi:hypothetical protein